MAHTIDDDESKVLSSIKMLGEGELKEKLLETFLQTMHIGTSSSSKGTISKALFVDASYETKSFKINQENTNPFK